jgi:hypothetical protein
MIKSKIRRARHVAYRRDQKLLQMLVEKPKGKTSLGRPGRRWEDDIKMDLKETWLEGVDWTELAERAVVNTAMNHRVPQKAGNILSSDY